MNDQPRDQQHAAELAALRREHPAYRIDRELHHSGTRYAATALALATRPWCVITHDPAELRSALSAPPCHRPAVGTGPPGGEYPQVIADEYPGWGVTYEDGQWTAWCPAVTVHAATPAGLRAAIEHAITRGEED